VVEFFEGAAHRPSLVGCGDNSKLPVPPKQRTMALERSRADATMDTSGNDYADWIGRTEVAHDVARATPAQALAATLDRPAPASGDPLPPLWHLLYFLPLAAGAEIGSDGHPRRGGFLPPVTLPRRMWAGSRFTFHRPVRIGDALARQSRILNVTAKHGRSGELLVVTVRHEIATEAGVAITEEQDIVYREAPAPRATAAPGESAPGGAEWSRMLTADPVLLFRYSALTFNSHRIHYDHPYATDVEGYPALVVHGPLTLLLDALQRQHPSMAIASLSVRAMRPLFAGVPFRLEGRLAPDGGADLWAVDGDGAMTMRASAGLTR
jgi:3-methylfumaryl-CoA hydratase